MNQEFKNARRRYLVGFLLCVVLTMSAYVLAINAETLFTGESFMAVGLLSLLALAQFIVQAVYFLHLDDEKGDRWKLFSFISMLSVVLIVVVGSLWIMWNLNYNMMPRMTGDEAEQHIIEDEGIRR